MEAQWYIGGIEQSDGVDLGLLVMDVPDWKFHTEALKKKSSKQSFHHQYTYMYLEVYDYGKVHNCTDHMHLVGHVLAK